MESTDFRPIHHNTVVHRALELAEQINYHVEEIQPYYNDMEAWERKEYQANFSDYTKSLNEKIEYIKYNQKLFNDILSEYGFTVVIFINKFLLSASFQSIEFADVDQLKLIKTIDAAKEKGLKSKTLKVSVVLTKMSRNDKETFIGWITLIENKNAIIGKVLQNSDGSFSKVVYVCE